MRESLPMNEPFPNQELNIAKNVRLIERLKIDLASQLAIIYKALLSGSENLVAQALSGMMITCYLLGKRLGISYASLDRTLAFRLKEMANEGNEPERQSHDLSLLSDYIEVKMR